MSKGLFIVFEGIDGSGKTTVCRMLEKKLKSLGFNVFFTSEPTNMEYGKILRRKLKSGMDPIEAVLLFALDRYNHVKIIREYLKKGYIVICDRYYYSSLAYQGALLGKDMMSYIESIHRPFILKPDLVFLLDVLPEIGLSRVRKLREGCAEIYEELK
ncbi:MAG: dTMP kinase, partial [Thermoplasmata archaeon]